MDNQNDQGKPEKVARVRIDQFKNDVQALKASGLTQVKIAEKLGMEDGNFSNYLNEAATHPITEKILARFYKAWSEELKALREKPMESYPNELSPEMGTQEEEAKTYTVKYYSDQLIDVLKKNNDALLSSLDKMMETNQKLVGNNEKLVSNNERLVESNWKLVEARLSPGGRQREKPDNGPDE